MKVPSENQRPKEKIEVPSEFLLNMDPVLVGALGTAGGIITLCGLLALDPKLGEKVIQWLTTSPEGIFLAATSVLSFVKFAKYRNEKVDTYYAQLSAKERREKWQRWREKGFIIWQIDEGYWGGYNNDRVTREERENYNPLQDPYLPDFLKSIYAGIMQTAKTSPHEKLICSVTVKDLDQQTEKKAIWERTALEIKQKIDQLLRENDRFQIVAFQIH